MNSGLNDGSVVTGGFDADAGADFARTLVDADIADTDIVQRARLG